MTKTISLGAITVSSQQFLAELVNNIVSDDTIRIVLKHSENEDHIRRSDRVEPLQGRIDQGGTRDD